MRALRWLVILTILLSAGTSDVLRDAWSATGSPTSQPVPTTEPTQEPPVPTSSATKASAGKDETPTPSETAVPPTPTIASAAVPSATAIPTATRPVNTPVPTVAEQKVARIAAAAASTITMPVADARVEEANPTTNYGNDPKLRADGGKDPDVNTYLRFQVAGLSGPPHSATLALWVTSGTANGPAVYACNDASWAETAITWANKPAVGAPTDDKGAIPANAWVTYDVTTFVTGSGDYCFTLITTSSDGIDFDSREAVNPPQLEIVPVPPADTPTAIPFPTDTNTPDAAPTESPAPTNSPTPTNTPQVSDTPVASDTPTTTATDTPTVSITSTPTSTATPTPIASSSPSGTPVPTGTPTGTSSPTIAATATPSPGATSTAAATGTFTFSPDADARVEAANSGVNFGTQPTLLVDLSPQLESYLRFTVSGVGGQVTSATLRLWVLDSTPNGPPIYSCSSTSWGETSITWANKPSVANPQDDKGRITAGTWLEYNVSALVASTGPVCFGLVAQSTDGVDFSSREGTNPPQLVVVSTGNATETPPATSTPSLTVTPTSTGTATATLTPTGTASSTATPTVTSTGTPTSSPTITATPSPGSGGTSTFLPQADARVEAANPATNFGTQPTLLVDLSPQLESYLRFDVNGLIGAVQKATLRLWVLDPTDNGPPVSSCGNASWGETTITWSNKPLVINPRDDKGAIAAGAWLEYDVSPFVTGNGSICFGLIGQSTNGVDFSSKEGANPPQLVVVTGSGGPTPTVTPTSSPTRTATVGPTPTPISTVAGGPVGQLVAAGDIAVCGSNFDEATANLVDALPGQIVILGDNAYNSGTLAEFNNCYGPSWGRHKGRTRPIAGNHDYAGTSMARGYFDYFNGVGVFSGPAGDRDKGYFSFTVGTWHVIALNSNCDKLPSFCVAGGPQEQWLRADLAAHTNSCTLAYWHHPHFSSGHDHNNNNMMLPIFSTLYEFGVDVVLVGHSHDYERFAPQNPNGLNDPAFGITEFVVGTGGAPFTGSSGRAANSVVFNNTTYGVLSMTLKPSSYDFRFVPITGQTFTDAGTASCHGRPGSANTAPIVANVSNPAVSAAELVAYLPQDTGPNSRRSRRRFQVVR